MIGVAESGEMEMRPETYNQADTICTTNAEISNHARIEHA